MADTIMTYKDFLKGLEGKVEGDFEKKRVELLDALNAKNEKRKNTPTKAQKENAPIKANIVEFVKNADGVVLGTAIAEGLGLTKQKASALARQLAEEGIFVAEDVQVKGKGKQKGYRLAEPVEVENEGEDEQSSPTKKTYIAGR